MMFKRQSKFIIALGFGVAIALMLALTFIGLSRMSSIMDALESIVRERNVQTELVSTMRTVARERVVALYSMTMLEDPFAKDEAFLHYQRLAGEFIRARERLEGMRLTPTERLALQESLRLVTEASRLQDQVVDLVDAGDTAAAHRTLLHQVLPVQDKIFAQYSRLLDLQRAQTANDVGAAEYAYSFATRFMVASGLAAVLLALGVGALVIARTREIENALFREKEQAEVTLHSIGDAVIATNSRGEVDYLNTAASHLTGWSQDQARGRPMREVFRLLDENTREPQLHLADHALPDGEAVGMKRQSLLVRRDGEEFLIEDRLSPICNRAGEVIGAVVVFNDVSHARQMASQLSWQATHDALTGLANRREFERLLGCMIAAAQREGKHHALLYLDLDQFKVVNDTCGHMAGDELLRQLVAVLVARGRDSDVVARLGGDEFGMLLYGCPLDIALRVANQVREAIQAFRFTWQDKAFEIGVSIGLVEVDADSVDLASVLSNADAACYAAKDRGRNRVHVYQENDTDLARRHGEMQWISRLSKAFEEKRFCLYYQKIMAVTPRPGDAQHFEVLLRMVDEEGNLVPPGAFIPAAERYNLMPSLDRWVIRTLFEGHSADWRLKWDEFRDRDEPCPLQCSVNLSATSLNDDLFPAFLREQIESNDVPPQVLCFEITETSAIANLAKVSQFMRDLAKLGCRFSLDDFGSGMSSFAYLKDLPVHYLKIDGAFVRGMEGNPVNQAMVEAISRIAHVMGIETVAEFVEDRMLLPKLAALGVDFAQGYGIHMPAPGRGQDVKRVVSCASLPGTAASPRPSAAGTAAGRFGGMRGFWNKGKT